LISPFGESSEVRENSHAGIFLMFLAPGNDFQAWKTSSQTFVMRADGKTGQYSVQQFMYPGLRISSVAATSIAAGYALASNE
jgi:hypothetical protein